MIELTINLIHKFELILFMAVDFIDETMFKTYFFRKYVGLLYYTSLIYYITFVISSEMYLSSYCMKKHGIKKIVRSLKMELTSFFILWKIEERLMDFKCIIEGINI